MQQLRAQYPLKSMRVDVNYEEQTDMGWYANVVFDKVEQKVWKLPKLFRRNIERADAMYWVEPMMRLLKGWKVQKLMIRCDFGTDDLFNHPELTDCLLGFVFCEKQAVISENVGGWNWNALEYNVITVKNHWDEYDVPNEDEDADGHMALKDQRKKDPTRPIRKLLPLRSTSRPTRNWLLWAMMRRKCIGWAPMT